MAAQLELYNDIQNNRLVVGLSDKTQFIIPAFYQGAKVTVNYYPVRPTGAASPPYFTQQVLATLLPFVYIGPRAGASAVLASQETWTPVVDTTGIGYFTASLDLNTTQMNTAVGSSDQLSTFLEIQLSESGVRRVVFQSQITVLATVYDIAGAVTLPSPATSYLTREEALGLFVKWVNNTTADRGKGITLTSPDGASFRTLGIRDDKSAQDDLV